MLSRIQKLSKPFSRLISFAPRSKYGGRQTITCIPSFNDHDHIMDHVKSLLVEFGAPIDFETVQLSSDHLPVTENDDLQYAITTIRRNGAALISHLATKQLAANIAIKNALKLHSCVCHIKSYPGLQRRHNNIDTVIVFQNVEGEYAGLEHQVIEGVVEMVKVATEESYTEVAETAFQFAQENNRKTIHAIHSARHFPLVDGLFLKVMVDVSKKYPDVALKTISLRTFMSRFSLVPEEFDVVCCPNAYGSGITAMVCGICGGPGLYSSFSYGNGIMVFEPAARKAKLGEHFGNPIAILNAATQLLYFLGCGGKASKLKQAIDATINKDRIHTKDLGGNASTAEIIENVLVRLNLREIRQRDSH